LHQVKYPAITGVPPVAKGTLMFYNMGDFNASESDNSILNLTQAAKYVTSLEDYPLQLDIALPLYSWAVIFRNDKPVDILHEYDTNSLSSIHELKPVAKNLLIATAGFYYQGVYIQQNDRIKIEEVTPENLQEAANILIPHLKRDKRTILFFDLNQKTFNRIHKNEMETVFSILD
jgi:hypothetical protein